MSKGRRNLKEQLHAAEDACDQIILERIRICEIAHEHKRNYPEDVRQIDILYYNCDAIAVAEKCCIAKKLCHEEAKVFCSNTCQDILQGKVKDKNQRKICTEAGFSLSRCLNKYFINVADRSGTRSTFKEDEE